MCKPFSVTPPFPEEVGGAHGRGRNNLVCPSRASPLGMISVGLSHGEAPLEK